MDLTLINKIITVAPEMGFTGLTASDLRAALGRGKTAIEPFSYGFAVVNTAGAHPDFPGPILRMLYVDPDLRNHGHGTQMLREVLEKHSPKDPAMRLTCTGETLRTWFCSRGFTVLDCQNDSYLMEESAPARMKGAASARSGALYQIVSKFRDYAERHPDPELDNLVALLDGYAISLAFATVGTVSRKQTAKAERPRNTVTTTEILKFRDSYPRTSQGTPKKGWKKAAVAHFYKQGKSISRDAIADRLKKIAE